MALIVDCYNILHAEMPPPLAGLDEAGLCRAIARSVWRGQPVTVVCDGKVKPGGASESPVDEVVLLFAGKGKSADDVILDMIGADHSPRKLVIATSDHEIQKAARRRRCKVLSAERFIRTLSSRPGQGNVEARPTAPLDESEVGRWLEEFGVDDDE
jgi:predicted RNA-binding protein with PIN domain